MLRQCSLASSPRWPTPKNHLSDLRFATPHDYQLIYDAEHDVYDDYRNRSNQDYEERPPGGRVVQSLSYGNQHSHETPDKYDQQNQASRRQV